MPKIKIITSTKKIAADLYTPVGIYLRMRDRFRDTILLESTDSQAGENSRSVIAINAIGGIEVTDHGAGEYKFPGQRTENFRIEKTTDLAALLNDFLESFTAEKTEENKAAVAQGLFGYISYDAVPFFENIVLKKDQAQIPLLRYRLYQYVIIIDHFKDEILLCENKMESVESRIGDIEAILRSKDAPVFPFSVKGEELPDMEDETYRTMVSKGIAACKRGDVFQVVLSRSFHQYFTGDDFNVYRALRSINPGPYLFYFDYGDYKLMGSSPESQVIIAEGKATVHPIAGTFRRTGNDEADKKAALDLEHDAKENAEHIMLVDLARNDLSRVCSNTEVTQLKKIKYYSHVIHMVSEVQGTVTEKNNPFEIIGAVFPAGTLSGAPKHKAMQLIDTTEGDSRGFYGGAIGYIGFDKSCNHAIMIRTLLCRNNRLTYRAGAGITAASIPQHETAEVNHKLAAIKKAIVIAEGFG